LVDPGVDEFVLQIFTDNQTRAELTALDSDYIMESFDQFTSDSEVQWAYQSDVTDWIEFRATEFYGEGSVFPFIVRDDAGNVGFVLGTTDGSYIGELDVVCVHILLLNSKIVTISLLLLLFF
jgi:hypothetical protein